MRPSATVRNNAASGQLVGSWTLKCRSHYVIDRGKVIEAGSWSDEQVEAERRRDRTAKAQFHGKAQKVETPVQAAAPEATPRFWRRVWDRVSGR